MSATVMMRWDGETMTPANRYAKALADAEFVVGLAYQMTALEERSAKSHQAFFATVNDAWKNLSAEDEARWPTPDHLRRFALIQAGFADCQDIVCATNSEAVRLAAAVKKLDGYSLTSISDRVVRIWTAKSQKYRAMGKADFQASQKAVREFCASLIGVSPATLEREAGRSA